jgi:chromosome segregation ATPase
MAVMLLAAGAKAEEANPIGQVISLLGDLAAKVKKDGEAELKAYEDYFSWCDDVSKEKQFEIETSTSQKNELEAAIDEHSSTIENNDQKIADLSAAIATAEKDLKAATTIRDTEASDFDGSEKELVDAVDTLGRAIGVLEKEMAKGSAAFTQITQGSDLKAAMNALSVVIDAASFSASDKSRLTALVQAQQGSDDEDGELGAPAAKAYDNQSGGIMDVLGDMKEKAESQLSELRKEEKTAQYNYEMLKQSLEDQLANDNKELDESKSNKAAAEEGKATADGELSATVADLKDSSSTLKSTQEECMTVAADHDASVRARAEELKTIAEATKILAETTGGAVDQTYSLLQMQMRTGVDLAKLEVAAFIKKVARKHHSSALAQLASRITAVVRYGGGGDPFVKIRGLIQDMIAKLQKEGSEAATEKAYCDEELAKTEAKKGELDADIEKLTTGIDQAAAKSAKLKEEVKVLQSELATMAKEQSDSDAYRQEAHAVYLVAKADLELGLGGVRKALELLRNYYAAGDAALVQEDQPAKPVNHGAASGAGGSIISILEVAESDLATNLAKVETAEAEELEEYEKSTQENTITKAAKDQDVKYKTQEFTGLDKSIAELTSDRDSASSELGAVMEYYGKLKSRCIAKPESYESRAARRAAEIEGLKEALNILENEAALVQRSNRHGRHMRGGLHA